MKLSISKKFHSCAIIIQYSHTHCMGLNILYWNTDYLMLIVHSFVFQWHTWDQRSHWKVSGQSFPWQWNPVWKNSQATRGVRSQWCSRHTVSKRNRPHSTSQTNSGKKATFQSSRHGLHSAVQGMHPKPFFSTFHGKLVSWEWPWAGLTFRLGA